jgi:hypothetical protein
LSRDAVEVWREAGVIKEADGNKMSFLIDRLVAGGGSGSRFEEAVKPYTVRMVTTDFDGNAMFENVPDGEYYIYAITETRTGWAVWNYKFSPSSEDKTVLLDNKNAWLAY